MAIRYDIALEESDEPSVKNGDFYVSESDRQHIKDTINSAPGWWKEFPDEGVNIFLWLGSPASKQEMARKIRLELENDGYTSSNPIIVFSPNGDVNINPNVII